MSKPKSSSSKRTTFVMSGSAYEQLIAFCPRGMTIGRFLKITIERATNSPKGHKLFEEFLKNLYK